MYHILPLSSSATIYVTEKEGKDFADRRTLAVVQEGGKSLEKT